GHILALKADGTVFAWGDNSYGEVNLPSGLTNIVAVSGGYFHSLALASLAPVILPKLFGPIAIARGATTTVNANVVSGSPCASQWSQSGTTINGAMQTSLAISNFDLASAGAYLLTVSNQFGYDAAKIVMRLDTSPVV